MQFEKSNDTKIIESVLAEANVGDLIAYEDLSAAIGRDVREFARNALNSARRSLLNEKKMVFGVEQGVGLLRLNDSQVVDSLEKDRRKQKRAATRVIRKLSVVNFDGLDGERKRQHIVASAQFGALAMFASASARKKIEAKVNGDKKTLAIGETLKMFT